MALDTRAQRRLSAREQDHDDRLPSRYASKSAPNGTANSAHGCLRKKRYVRSGALRSPILKVLGVLGSSSPPGWRSTERNSMSSVVTSRASASIRGAAADRMRDRAA